MPAQKVSPRQIVAAARVILESEGPEALTMRALGERLGIRAPSLYHHFPDKAAVESALVATGLLEQALTLAAALAGAPGEPLAAVAAAYRAYARRHPHLYRLMTERPTSRERLPEGLAARAEAPMAAAAGGDPNRARAIRAFAHGMVALELAGRFGTEVDLDAAWRAGIEAFARR